MQSEAPDSTRIEHFSAYVVERAGQTVVASAHRGEPTPELLLRACDAPVICRARRSGGELHLRVGDAVVGCRCAAITAAAATFVGESCSKVIVRVAQPLPSAP